MNRSLMLRLLLQMMRALPGVSKSLILNRALRRMLRLNRGMRRNPARRQQIQPNPVPPTPSPPLPLPFNGRSGLSNRDRIAGVADLTIVVDAAAVIAVGVARAAGVAGNRAAICRHQNMLRRGLQRKINSVL